ncbi:hypothetical protein BCD64_14295 [Nostoc sp. MBR 210]|nr:hypothetical protein BCD64_14295 [Nostoc sp. MBR 210]
MKLLLDTHVLIWYRYVKSLLDKSDEKLENWRNISEWLDDAGYKNQSINVPGLDLSPDKAVVNVTKLLRI